MIFELEVDETLVSKDQIQNILNSVPGVKVWSCGPNSAYTKETTGDDPE